MAVETQSEIDFSALVLGLSSAALSYLGYTSDGQYRVEEQALGLAAQNIEIIAMLQKKTKGNLTNDEDQLIQQVLTDLRLKYVEAQKKLSC